MVTVSTTDLPTEGKLGVKVSNMKPASLSTIISYDTAIRNKNDNIKLLSGINILLAEDKDILEFPLLDLNALLYVKKMISSCTGEYINIPTGCITCKSINDYRITLEDVTFSEDVKYATELRSIKLGSKSYKVRHPSIKDFSSTLSVNLSKPLPLIYLASLLPELSIVQLAKAEGKEAYILNIIAKAYMTTTKPLSKKCPKCGGDVEVDVNNIPSTMFRLQRGNFRDISISSIFE